MTLADLGWSAHFDQHRDPDMPGQPARVSEVTRATLTVLTETGTAAIITPDSTGLYAVGDWVLTDGIRSLHRLDRMTEIGRRAAGPTADRQLIAANVDTLAIVTSLQAAAVGALLTVPGSSMAGHACNLDIDSRDSAT